jgi:hypothetical protein
VVSTANPLRFRASVVTNRAYLFIIRSVANCTNRGSPVVRSAWLPSGHSRRQAGLTLRPLGFASMRRGPLSSVIAVSTFHRGPTNVLSPTCS